MAVNAQQSPVKSMRPFFIIWFGQLFSLAGSSIVQFALPWWLTLRATEATDNPATVLAIATLMSVMPQVVLGPVAGALVDRWNRRVVMMVADGVVAFASLILLSLFAMDVAQIWHVYVVMFIRSLGGAFHWPAMQASTSLMVPKKHLARVAGLNQTVNGALNIAGPALGALLLELLQDMTWIMLVDVVTATFAILPLFFVYVPQPKRADMESGGEQPTMWADLRAGFVYAWRWPGLLVILAMSMVINATLTPAFSLMPLLVKEHFLRDVGRVLRVIDPALSSVLSAFGLLTGEGQAMSGVVQLATAEGAWGLGMLLGGLTLSVWGGFRSKVVTSLTGLILMGIGIGVVGLAPPDMFWLAVAALLLAGFMNPIVNGPLFAVLQAAVAPEMQGRIFMLLGSVSILATPLGLGVAGPLADIIGVPAFYVSGGVMCIIMGIIALFIPAVVKIEQRMSDEGPSDAVMHETSGLPGALPVDAD